jgi:hypothetical protein
MKPPICAVCHKEFFDELEEEKGGLIYFTKRNLDEKWEDEMRKEGFVGHPPYAEWFCQEHYGPAKELSKMTIDKAMDILRKKFPKNN